LDHISVKHFELEQQLKSLAKSNEENHCKTADLPMLFQDSRLKRTEKVSERSVRR